MPVANKDVTLAYVNTNFRKAKKEDFIWGLQYYVIEQENVPSQSGNNYKITGEQVGFTKYNKGIMDFVEELRFFVERLEKGILYIATSYVPPA